MQLQDYSQEEDKDLDRDEDDERALDPEEHNLFLML
jgi:hypothetical protein